jgi:cell division protein FtsI/penicillin-binding protein 2
MVTIQRRIGLLFAAFMALLLLATMRAAWLGTISAPGLQHAASSQQVSQTNVPARRGAIVDRNGVPLAISEPADDIAATPYLVRDPVATARRIAAVLHLPADQLLRQLARKDTGFAYLARGVPADSAQAVDALKVPGLDLIPTMRRTYPRSLMAAQLFGSVGTDGNGLSGLEYYNDKLLHGHDGERSLTRDALGQPIGVHDQSPALAGHTLRLTLDATIQSKVEAVLAGIGQVYRPKDATAIVMDPRTGAVLAMANWPRVDANDIAGAPPYARQNRAVSFDYEPGSTFKPITIAGALTDHVVTPDTTFSLGSQIQVADRTIHNAEGEGPATLTTSQILAQSNNVGTITIGMRLGAQHFDTWVRRFGFGKPTGIDLPGEERGQVLPVTKYSGSSMGNLPIGQGESVTPMQIATAYAALANGGILRPAHVVESVGSKATPVRSGHRVISAQVSGQIRKMLEGVFAPGGTAHEVSVPGYQLAGKTGTANKIDPATGTYSKSRYVASFVGFAPAASPKLLTAVMVDEPQGAIYGGTVAAPAFGQIMAFALPYLRIAP